jgi:prepilin-type N-terminal cleavage/methylation domain-containing protein
MKRKAFTLIELLVVISIIVLLVSIIMPSFSKVKKLSKRVICSTNLKAIGTGFILYMEEHPGYLPEAAGFPTKSAEGGIEGVCIADVMTKYIPKDAWRCPDDDQSFFETYGTSYEYPIGHLLTLFGGFSGIPGFTPELVRETLMVLISTGEIGDFPGVSEKQREQINQPTPLALDAEAFHPSQEKPEGRQAVYFNGEVKYGDWEDIEEVVTEEPAE